MSEFYSKPIDTVLTELNTNKDGLTNEEAKKRLEEHGYNELKEEKKKTPLQIFLSQFNSFLIWVLIAAAIISAIIGYSEGEGYTDAIVIMIIVVLSAIFGFYEEYNAEKALEALKRMAALKTKVMRNGKIVQKDARELVPGDIIILDTGYKIPADARIIEEMSLETNESALTGESVPVKKSVELIKKAQIADQSNMVFSSTIVTKGKGKAVVTQTGMKTEIGKIATMVQETETRATPLQKNVDQFGKWLGVLILIICGIIFAVRLLRNFITIGSITGNFILETFMVAVSLAVAAIPEALPIIVTSTLAIGVKRMVKRHALIRKLPAVESLGCTNVICSDKTGTLTCNEMTVRELYVNYTTIYVSGKGYTPVGEFIDKKKKKVDSKDISLLLQIGCLCNDAILTKDEKWEVYGDPTEGSLIVSAAKIGLKKEELEKKYPRKEDIPFDSERKLMTTVHKINGEKIAYVKGAPDMLINKCTSIYKNGKIIKLTEADKKKIMNINQDMAKRALRVLGFAFRSLITEKNKDRYERNLTFVGLQGMIDPPREEVKAAILECKQAGISSVMITGDHKLTAIAVAKELDMFKEGDLVLTGEELDKIDDENFYKIVEKVKIYARVNPSHKVRILEAYQKKGHIVAMTGDGVNDAPALKKSDVGVAMGITGTDVSKEASDMVLTDDNFASIVNAVEEGRGIYANIRKFIEYLLSCNIAEVLVVFLSVLIGLPLPLVAIQILLMNLITDGVPALALGVLPINKGLMKDKPRDPKERIVSKTVLRNILFVGVLICIGTLTLFYLNNPGTDKARTIAFTTIVMFQLFYVLTYAAERFRINIRRNKYLIAAFTFSVLLQISIVHLPFLNTHLKTVPIGLYDWLIILGVTFSLFIIVEIRKIIIARRSIT